MCLEHNWMECLESAVLTRSRTLQPGGEGCAISFLEGDRWPHPEMGYISALCVSQELRLPSDRELNWIAEREYFTKL